MQSDLQARPSDRDLFDAGLEVPLIRLFAVESFARAAALRPEFAEAHNDLGEVLLRLGRTDAAIASCRRRGGC